MKIMITGGAGYIGSHACLVLLNAGFEIVVVDNLSNSSITAIQRVEELTQKKIKFYKLNLLQTETLSNIFKAEKIDIVMHFAGLKAVGESNQKPLQYYQENFMSTLSLIEAMNQNNVYNLIFSSSATVYGNPQQLPIIETSPTHATNPYGRTKLFIEEMLKDIANANPQWKIVLLRYFNPIGAHESGQIGEDPKGIPNNLMPYISKVAIGKLPILSIFGNDYETIDGTGIRDYIHVMDLVEGHLAALQYHHIQSPKAGIYIYNLGTGQGYSVLEILETFQKIINQKIPYQFSPRREGDIAICYANTDKAKNILNWQTQRDLKKMILDTWHWQQLNPNGYT